MRREAVADVRIVEDLGERPTLCVLPQDVRGDAFLCARPREQEREWVPQEVGEPAHADDCILSLVKPTSAASRRFAEREVHGVDDAGVPERIVVWIERRADGEWAVGRAVNPQLRSSSMPRRDDYVFEGWELDDAVEQANAVLEDDVTVSENDGFAGRVRPFVKADVLQTLERWFFGRPAR